MKFSDRKENVRLTNSLIGINNHSHFRQSFPHSLVNRIWKRIDFRAQSIIGEGGNVLPLMMSICQLCVRV